MKSVNQCVGLEHYITKGRKTKINNQLGIWGKSKRNTFKNQKNQYININILYTKPDYKCYLWEELMLSRGASFYFQTLTLQDRPTCPGSMCLSTSGRLEGCSEAAKAWNWLKSAKLGCWGICCGDVVVSTAAPPGILSASTRCPVSGTDVWGGMKGCRDSFRSIKITNNANDT